MIPKQEEKNKNKIYEYMGVTGGDYTEIYPYLFYRGYDCSETNNAALFRAKNSLFEIFETVKFV